MANKPDDLPSSNRVTPKGGPAKQAPVTKAAQRKAAAEAAARKARLAEERSGSTPVKRRVRSTEDETSTVTDARAASRSGNPKKKAAATAATESSRYTAPIPQGYGVSPWYIPVLLFGFLGLGMIIIFFNYMQWPFGDPSNWRLLGGLGCILAGILVATRYQQRLARRLGRR